MTYLNPAASRLLGWPASELPGRHWLESVHPNDRPTVETAWAAACGERGPFTAQFRLLTAGGDYRWQVGTAGPRCEAGRLVGWAGSWVDAHPDPRGQEGGTSGLPPRATNASLADNRTPCPKPVTNARTGGPTTAAVGDPAGPTTPHPTGDALHLLRAVTDGTPDAVFVKDLGGRYLLCNPAAARFMGRAAGEVLGKSDGDLFDPASARLLAERDREAVAAGGPVHGVEVLTAAGVTRTYEVTKGACRDAAGAVVGLFGISRDVTDRVRAEEELRAAEHRSRVILESVTDAFFALSRGWRFTYVNREAERLLGRTRDDLLGKHIWEEYAPAVGTAFESNYARAMAENVPATFEAFYPPLGRWFEVHAYPTADGLAVYFRDVSGRRAADEAIRESEAQYRLLFDANPQPMWVYAPDTLRFLAVNRTAVDRYGYSRDEFLSMTLADIRPPEDVPALCEFVTQPAGEWTDRRVWRHRWKDGTLRDVEVSAHNLTYDGRQARLALATDVTDRESAAATARRSQAVFRAFMDNTPAVAFIKDVGGRYVYANRRWEEQFDPPRRDWEGKADDAFWPPEAAARFRQSDRAVFDTDRATQAEEVVTAGGRSRHFLTLKFPVEDEAGRRAVGGVVLDMTEQKLLEEQFRQAQKMEAVGRLAGGIAHDFNNLLTVINGYSDLLLGTLPAADPSRDCIREVHRAGERAAGLTRQMLAFSRKQVVEPRVLNLNEVVGGVAAMLRRVIGEDVQLDLVAAPTAVPVTADPGQVEQVLVNLCVNARDAMPTGGRLTVALATGPLPAALAPDGLVTSGGYAELRVSDTGTGIPADLLPHIWEPFFTTKAVGSGTGLGLATVYGVVTAHGGRVAVDSRPGHGTTFRVYLPLTDRPAATRSGLSLPSALPRGAETVLVVEDEEAVRALTVRVLSGCGYAVLEADGGRQAEAVAAAHPGPVHLLVTDVVMPGPGGRAVAERLTASRPGVRVLYLSGYTDDAVVRHGVAHQAVHFLSKPFTPLALARKVREVLDGPPAGRTDAPTA